MARPNNLRMVIAKTRMFNYCVDNRISMLIFNAIFRHPIKYFFLNNQIKISDYINEVLHEDDTEPKSSKEEWDSPITFTAKSSRMYLIGVPLIFYRDNILRSETMFSFFYLFFLLFSRKWLVVISASD